MDISIIFKIAIVGIVVSILYRVLHQSGREEIAILTGLAGVIIVCIMIISLVNKLFDSVKTMFQF